MNIALLNERITIQKAVVVSDDIGNRTNAWEDYYSCACTVGGEAGKESSGAGQVTEHTDISFSVRSCKSTDAVTSTGYRILFNGTEYDIILIDHMNYKHKCVKFKCRKT